MSVTGRQPKRWDASLAVGAARAPAPLEPLSEDAGRSARPRRRRCVSLPPSRRASGGCGARARAACARGVLVEVQRSRELSVSETLQRLSVRARGGLGAPAVPESPSDARGAEAGAWREARLGRWPQWDPGPRPAGRRPETAPVRSGSRAPGTLRSDERGERGSSRRIYLLRFGDSEKLRKGVKCQFPISFCTSQYGFYRLCAPLPQLSTMNFLQYREIE